MPYVSLDLLQRLFAFLLGTSEDVDTPPHLAQHAAELAEELEETFSENHEPPTCTGD